VGAKRALSEIRPRREREEPPGGVYRERNDLQKKKTGGLIKI